MVKTKWVQSMVTEAFYQEVQEYANRHYDGNVSLAIRAALKAAMDREG